MCCQRCSAACTACTLHRSIVEYFPHSIQRPSLAFVTWIKSYPIIQCNRFHIPAQAPLGVSFFCEKITSVRSVEMASTHLPVDFQRKKRREKSQKSTGFSSLPSRCHSTFSHCFLYFPIKSNGRKRLNLKLKSQMPYFSKRIQRS